MKKASEEQTPINFSPPDKKFESCSFEETCGKLDVKDLTPRAGEEISKPKVKQTPSGAMPELAMQTPAQMAELTLCYEVLKQVLCEQKFLAKAYLELTQKTQSLVWPYLENHLSECGMMKVTEYLTTKQRNPLHLPANYFQTDQKRLDATLKLVVSADLHKLLEEFKFKEGINQTTNSSKYIERKKINLRIYKSYFQEVLVKGEEDKIFCIKDGVTREWFQTAIGGHRRNPAFILALLDILKGGQLFTFYKKKISSSIRRYLGIEKKPKTSNPENPENPKVPANRVLFEQGIAVTIKTIEAMAAERGVKLPSINRR